MNEESELINRAVGALARMEKIMDSEGEKNFIQGIRAAIAIGRSHVNSPGREEEILEEMRSLYRTMVRARGGIEEFFIWREALEERVEVNKDLDLLKTELWQMLGDSE